MYFTSCSSVSIVNFEHVIPDWESKFMSFMINFYVDKLFGVLHNQDIRASDAHRCIQNSSQTLKMERFSKIVTIKSC